MYVVVIAALTELVHLPFAFYYGVVLERRYGLSTETPGRWLKDHFKAAVIALIVLVVAGVLVAWASPRYALTHAKLAVIDRARLVVMTLNLTRSRQAGCTNSRYWRSKTSSSEV